MLLAQATKPSRSRHGFGKSCVARNDRHVMVRLKQLFLLRIDSVPTNTPLRLLLGLCFVTDSYEAHVLVSGVKSIEDAV